MSLSINLQSSLGFIDRFNQAQNKDSQKLASGLRINSAADDAAGLQIATRLTSQVDGFVQLGRNAQDQIGINNTKSAQFSSITESLQRANVLSIQSGNPLTDSSAIQDQFNQISQQINAIAGKVLGQNDFLSGLDAKDPKASQAAIQDALAKISHSSSSVGADTNALTSQISTYETSRVNVSAARSRIQDTNFSASAADQAKNNILFQASIITQRAQTSQKGLLINQLI